MKVHLTILDEDGETTLHECNDCGILIEEYRPICTLCERWYEQNGIKPFGGTA
jgi:hypothetical protein